MDPALKQALVIGAVAGLFMGMAMYWASGGKLFWFALIPVAALMGAGAVMMKGPVEDDEPPRRK